MANLEDLTQEKGMSRYGFDERLTERSQLHHPCGGDSAADSQEGMSGPVILTLKIATPDLSTASRPTSTSPPSKARQVAAFGSGRRDQIPLPKRTLASTESPISEIHRLQPRSRPHPAPVSPGLRLQALAAFPPSPRPQHAEPTTKTRSSRYIYLQRYAAFDVRGLQANK